MSSKQTPPAPTRDEMSSSSSQVVSKDIQVIQSMLKEAGIDDYDPQVVNQLLEFNYLYTTTVLDDAKMCSTYAKKKDIDADDVRVAVHMTEEAVFFKPVSREVLMSTSHEVNKIPLPLVKQVNGLQIPRDHILLQTDYALKTDTDSEQNMPKINTITTAAEILEESRKKEETSSGDDEFMNDSIDFDLQEIIKQLDCNNDIEEYVKDELLEFQPFESSTCFEMALGNIGEQEWPTQNK